MWWRQFLKELRGHRGEILLLVGALLVWTAFLYSRVGVWEPELIVLIYWFPMGFLPLWAIWTSVQLYRQEWRENTSYLMLSLPVRAWTITSAKLAIVAAGILGFSALIFGGAALLTARTGFFARIVDVFEIVPLDWMIKTGLIFYGAMIFGILVGSLISQFAYVFSRLFSRFQGLAMVWTWFLTIWLMGEAAWFGHRFLGWMPDLRLQAYYVMNNVPGTHAVAIETGPILAVALFLAGLYWVLNVTVERAVEV